MSEASIIAAPTLTTSPPISADRRCVSSVDVLAERALSASLSAATCASRERLGAGHFGGDLAALLGDEPAEGGDHLGHGEQPAVGGADA